LLFAKPNIQYSQTKKGTKKTSRIDNILPAGLEGLDKYPLPIAIIVPEMIIPIVAKNIEMRLYRTLGDVMVE
jgi:hypothetical protein